VKAVKKVLLILLVIALAAGGYAWSRRDSLIGLLKMKRSAETPQSSADILGQAAKNGKKILTVYFSWSGNTRRVAQKIHKMVGGDLFEIRPEKPYPAGYNETVDLAKKEKADNSRPAIAGPLPDMKNYDIVILGYPIWWYIEPMIIDTFAETEGLDGKTVFPFATSGGSTITESVKHLRSIAPKADIRDGLLANIESRIEPWLKENGLM
jgi:flavodoxin